MKKKLITIAVSSALALSTVSIGVADNLSQASNSVNSHSQVSKYHNISIIAKQSPNNPAEYSFGIDIKGTKLETYGMTSRKWFIDDKYVSGSDIHDYIFKKAGEHTVSVQASSVVEGQPPISYFTSTTINVKTSRPTEATWTVDPSIGTTASAIAAEFNSASEKEQAGKSIRFKVTAEGNKLHFVCNPGTFVTPAAANLPAGSEINTNKTPDTIKEIVPGVQYISKGALKGSLLVLDLGPGQASNAYKEHDTSKSYEWAFNCLKPQATQATYTVDPSTGATAAGVVHELYNHKTDDPEVPGIGEGVASAVAKGNNIVYTCKSGYHISEVAANLPVGSQTHKNGDLRTESIYPMVVYVPGSNYYGAETFRSNFASNGHKAPAGAHLWGVDCIK
ncbi:hypothetical protein [Francisella sp. SYW-9]|uniref:hypothetical protein n=1 Tax=Francisella sp. SYW-9 TaxID=2610888 RepID=UPI00123CD384|nr:hypothetical protein [Francisella sp. SYW-9]